MSPSTPRPLLRMATALVAFVAMPTTALAQVAIVSCGTGGANSIYRVSSSTIDAWEESRLEYRSVCVPNRVYSGDTSTCSVSSEMVRWTWTVQPIPGFRAGWTSEWRINRRTGVFSFSTERTNGTGDASDGRCTLAEDPSLQVRPLF